MPLVIYTLHMAKIVPILGDLKGSIAGSTFQTNTSGAIVRHRPRVTRSSTPKQQLSHQRHQFWLAQWQALTQTQRDLWNVFAATYPKTDKFGNSRNLTGANWFESANSNRYLILQDPFLNPPAHVLPDDAPPFTLTLTAEKIIVHLTASFDFTNNYLLGWVAMPTLRSKTSINQIRRYIGNIPSTGNPNLDITTAWQTATGLTWSPTTLFPNTNIFVCLQAMRKGSGITTPMLCTKSNTVDNLMNSIVILEDQKASGTDGGTFTSGAWQTRTLNTEVYDNGGICTLSSNQFTIPAGTYKVIASAPCYNGVFHKIKLRNITDSSDTVIGSSEVSAAATNVVSRSWIDSVFTIAATKTFEIQHRCGTTASTDGFGRADSFSVIEVYTQVCLEKIA